jgi:uncharacterized protein YbgA (DUF1722 family)/uncharacterized protein YbbK (DUF523 family)
MKTYETPTVFISACIEFESCRYDGEKISDEYIQRLIPFVKVIRTCPELAIGMGAPRDAVRLVQRKGESLKLLSTNKGNDFTEPMQEYTSKYTDSLLDKEIDGFIMKAKSPTCGVNSVKIYQNIGKAHVVSAKNPGLFGGKIREKFPNTPIETERRLSNFNIRNRFLTEIFTLAEYRKIKKISKMKDLVRFHSLNKYLFMTYNQVTLRELGNTVANHGKLPVEEVYEIYEVTLRKLLSSEPTKKKRINVLEHIYGYFKDDISKEEKDYYFEVQNEYLDNRVPYSSVLTVLKGWTIRFGQSYLVDQTIFAPYPKDLIMVTDSGKTV